MTPVQRRRLVWVLLALLASGRHPFADVSRRIVGLDGAAALLTDMAGEGAAPPLHGVVVPGATDGS